MGGKVHFSDVRVNLNMYICNFAAFIDSCYDSLI